MAGFENLKIGDRIFIMKQGRGKSESQRKITNLTTHIVNLMESVKFTESDITTLEQFEKFLTKE